LFSHAKSQERKRILNIIRNSSRDGKDIIIRSASSKDAVAKSFDTGLRHKLDRFSVSDMIASFIGEIAKSVIQEVNINGVLLTGGDIFIKTARSLGVSGTIIKNEILPGIPYGNFAGEQYKGITIVSKAGGFGKEDAIFEVLNFLNRG
jgi:uncharacterized protein YgbK (DUF1537 family)